MAALDCLGQALAVDLRYAPARARELFRRSVLINPNSAMALTLAGWIETMYGNGAPVVR